MATKKRMKRFDDGGMTSNTNYPFGQGQSQMQTPTQDAGGLGNTSPLVQVNATPFGMKKGGAVSTSKVKKMAVGGMGGMELKPVGPAKPMPGSGFGGSTVLPTPPRGPKGPAMELKPIGGGGQMPGFMGKLPPNISGSPNGMPTRGPGSLDRFMGGMERKPVGGMIGIGSMSPQLASRVGSQLAPKVGSQLMGGMKKGGAVKKMASGGSTSSASSRADGIASKGKTRGKMC